MFLKLFGKKTGENEAAGDGGAGLVEGIDRTMNYCPRCGDEYRGEIVTCVSCQIQLISGEEKLLQTLKAKEEWNHRSMDIGPEDELLTIRKGPLKDIKNLQKLLEKERIPSIIAGDENSCNRGCCGPEMFLQIKSEDQQRANILLLGDFVATTALDLKDLQRAEVVFDQGAKETVCPACGCSFSPTVGACPGCGLCFE